MKPVIIVATRNAHKLQELRQMLASLGADVCPVSDFGALPDIVEDRPTFEGNAIKKASETVQQLIARGVNEPFVVLADDSGLEVEALNGAPGVYSARFAAFEGLFPDNIFLRRPSTRKVSDLENNQKLLRLLKDVPNVQRGAKFRCVIAVASRDGHSQTADGVCPGKIIHQERGAHGFGYDPLFVPNGYDKTYAELGADIKDLISHRGRAMEGTKELLRTLL